MDTELRKRLEEAAKYIADKKFPGHRASENDRRAREDYQLCRDSCIVGMEYGYKEAIARAKEWLKDNRYECLDDDMIVYFEVYMNKLWEG